MRRTRGLAAAVAFAAAGATAFALVPRASAQRIDPRRAAVLVVGSPRGSSPMFRVDARRSGATHETLPGSPLRIAWSKATAMTLDQAALAGSDGTLAVVTARGDVLFLDLDGDEREKVNVGAGAVGPATMTSDGTVVFATAAGDVVGVKSTLSRPRYTTRIGGELERRAAPLALDDGGVVVATKTDLVVLDAEGGLRARTTLVEGAAAPLLASGDRVLAITSSGTVFGWTPGREPVRLGSFGAATDGGAALLDASTLVAVIEGNHVVDLDVAHGTRTTRALAPQGLYLGPPAVRGNVASLLAMTPSRAFVVNVDPAGQETIRAPIAQLAPAPLADGGVAPLVAPAHAGPLVDPRGAIAFAALDGRVGMLRADGVVEMAPDRPCLTGVVARTTGIVGITPFGRGAFVVTCERGSIVKIAGPDAEASQGQGQPKKPRSAPSSTTSPPRNEPPPAPTDLDEDDPD